LSSHDFETNGTVNICGFYDFRVTCIIFQNGGKTQKFPRKFLSKKSAFPFPIFLQRRVWDNIGMQDRQDVCCYMYFVGILQVILCMQNKYFNIIFCFW